MSIVSPSLLRKLLAQKRWRLLTLFPEESRRFGEAPSMPFLRRAAFARARRFSGSQRVQVSGVFVTHSAVSPERQEPALVEHIIEVGSGMQVPLGGGRGRPPRQTPWGRTHAAGLNGRHAHHHVRPALSTAAGVCSPSRGSAATSRGGRLRSLCPARPGSGGRGSHRAFAALLRHQGLAKARLRANEGREVQHLFVPAGGSRRASAPAY